MKSFLKIILSNKMPRQKISINVYEQFIENCSCQCLKKCCLNEKSFENNSEQENSKEILSLSVDVNIQFTQNSPSQCWDKTIHLNEQFAQEEKQENKKILRKI